LHIFYEFYVI